MIKSICFLATYQCNAQCDYCECGPHVQDRLSCEEIIRLIDEAYDLGTVGLVVFSGGEPTLLNDDLFRCIRHASDRGLLTRIVTNGWWGQSPGAADRFVEKLMDAGLSEINISVDDLHQKWIPVERVKNAFLACYGRRLKCLIAHKQTKSSVITKEYLEGLFGIPLVPYERGKKYGEEEECQLISTGTIIPVGRNDAHPDWNDLLFAKWTSSCSSVLTDIIVGADGRFLPCCGIVTKNVPELTRNDLTTTRLIDAIDEANRDVILNWIALEGPAAIAGFVKRKSPEIDLPERYVGICHVCNEVLTRPDVRQVLSAHLDEITERVSLHRSFFELARGDDEIAKVYTKP